MNQLEKFLNQSKHLKTESIILLMDFWKKKKTLKPKEILIDFNQKDEHLYFVISGCVKLFVINEKNEEVCLGFGYDNTLITCFQSFVEGKPSILSIESILETELLCISRSSLYKLIEENVDIASWYQHMLEITISGHIQRQVELLTLSPQEKYKVFIKRSGHLINSIPLRYIASYLMMKPETLSRVRAKIS